MKDFLRKIYRKYVPAPVEPLMYRTVLFDEFMSQESKDRFAGTRILEIGPKDDGGVYYQKENNPAYQLGDSV